MVPVITMIGSREFDEAGNKELFDEMMELANRMSKFAYIRSGGAVGIDTAVEMGAGNKTIIYLPYDKFNSDINYGGNRKTYASNSLCTEWTEMNSPNLTEKNRCYLERDFIQVAGEGLDEYGHPVNPSLFVIAAARTNNAGMIQGGSRHAFNTALKWNDVVPDAGRIPAFNISLKNEREAVKNMVSEIETTLGSKDKDMTDDEIRATMKKIAQKHYMGLNKATRTMTQEASNAHLVAKDGELVSKPANTMFTRGHRSSNDRRGR